MRGFGDIDVVFFRSTVGREVMDINSRRGFCMCLRACFCFDFGGLFLRGCLGILIFFFVLKSVWEFLFEVFFGVNWG